MAGAADEWAALGCGGAVAAGSGGSGGGDDAGGGGPAGVDAAAAAVLAVPAERKNRWLSSCLSGALLIPPAPTTASPRGGGSGGGGGGGAAAAVALSGELRAATLFSPSADRGRHSALPFLPLLSPGAQLLSASSSVRSSCSLEMSNSDLERGAGRSLGWQMDLQHTVVRDQTFPSCMPTSFSRLPMTSRRSRQTALRYNTAREGNTIYMGP